MTVGSVPLAEEKFVLLTSFRRSGAGVLTPVWVAPAGDELVVWTGADSGKIKRLRRDPRVELTPCDRRGRARPGAQTVNGRARIVADDPERKRLGAAIAAKYGMEFRLIRLIGSLLGRRGGSGRVVIAITTA
ncbi:MAG TPA: PPOX class F420-dependent oxidoreductase [Solirubrobacteraceae bacterium]|nr:PPOX class F420-dependent oxidoreductase [Solirubrobacteraceae bacterium]